MRVLVNRLTALKQKTGIGHYVAMLLTALRERAGEGEVHVYPGPWEEKTLRALKAWRGPKRKSTAAGPGKRDGKLGLFLHRLGRNLSGWHFRLFYGWRRFDVYHEPNAIPLPCPWPTVATVCDLSVLLHPEWHPADRVAYYEKHFPPGLKRCDQVLTISEFSKREIVRHFGVPPERVTVTYPGINPSWRPLPREAVESTRHRLGLPAQYLLHVGTLEPRKNLLLLLKAYVALPSELREQCPLVLVGGWGWNVGALRTYFDEVARHRGVRHLGYVLDEDLPALYNGARALVFPTHYEGFGFPPLEMFACGGAVLASTAGAVAETIGDRAHLLDAGDEAGWHGAMEKIIREDGWLAQLRQGVIDVPRAYTWQRCAEQTWAVYRKVGEKRAQAA